MIAPSLATGLRLLGRSDTLPLSPLRMDASQCPNTGELLPIEVVYDYAALDSAYFDRPVSPGLEHWSALLPPLPAGLSMVEGGTPLLHCPELARWAGFDGAVYVKDESRNPTWSHKDRYNLCAVAAAHFAGAPGVVVTSSGNHAASAAAYAARAGLPCIALVSHQTPPAVQRFVAAYGTAVVAVPRQARWTLLAHIAEHLGYHPVSNMTTPHTGHPWGAEGYRTIAFELFAQLKGQIPDAVYVPTGYGELLFGLAKGFGELRDLRHTGSVPQMVACEPDARAPLAQSMLAGRPITNVPDRPTDAYAIGVTVASRRGMAALQTTNGFALPLCDDAMRNAQAALGRAGMWAELSAAASLAGLREAVRQGRQTRGSAVCVVTSSGFKDRPSGDDARVPATGPDWAAVLEVLRDHYGLAV